MSDKKKLKQSSLITHHSSLITFFSSFRELPQRAAQERLDGKLAAFLYGARDGLLRGGLGEAELRERGERVFAQRVFGLRRRHAARGDLLFERGARQRGHLVSKLYD